jgi:hypothetical protein
MTTPTLSRSGTATPALNRAPRCRLLNRLRNPCPNLAISDFGLCLRHLRDAHAEYEQVLGDAGIRALRVLAD